jgi:hypothetical protein
MKIADRIKQLDARLTIAEAKLALVKAKNPFRPLKGKPKQGNDNVKDE